MNPDFDERPVRPLGVLLICDSYPPVLGGSEIEAQRVSAALIQRGHHVQVLCSGGPLMPEVRDWIDPAGVPVSILTRRSRGRLKDILMALQVARAVWRGRNRYDVVYFLMQGLHLMTGLPMARMLGKPIIMKISGSGVIPLMRSSWAGRIELYWLRRWAARIMILNEGMVEEAIDFGFCRSQMVWMPNPVDTTAFQPSHPGESDRWRRQHGIPLTAQTVIYVGRLSHEKGLPELLAGFAEASRRCPHSVLILVGDGPQRAELENLAGELKLNSSQILFVGRVNVSDVPFWLGASDIFALTSPSEGFSCALVEAMATGLPSVVTDIIANRQLVEDGVHGIMIPPHPDQKATGTAFIRLLEDPDLRRRMGQAARQRVVEKFSTERVVERYEALLSQVTSAPHAQQ